MAQDDIYGTTRAMTERSADLAPLANEVISVLRERQTVTTAGARQVVVDYLVRAVAVKATYDPVLVLDELRGYRLTLDAIIDLYIPQAARRLGDMWMTSDIDFAGVTVGSLRLQALLGEASMGLRQCQPAGGDATFHALVVVPEQEQHFLGAAVVGAQLRRLGCEVSLAISETPKQVLARVVCDVPDMVLFSCARVPALETAKRTVKKIKSSVDPVPVLAMGGALRGKAEAIKEQTGVDLVTNTATDVLSFCTKRRKALGLG